MLRSFYLLLLSVTLCANAQAAGPTAATASASAAASASEPVALAPLPKRSTFQVIAATAAHVQQLRQGNLCISPQRMCLHMRAGCGSIPAYAAI